MDPGTLPPQHILDLMRRGQQNQDLTPAEQGELQRWASSNAAKVDPAWISGIATILGEMPAWSSTVQPGAVPAPVTTPTWGGTPEHRMPQPAQSPIADGAAGSGTNWVTTRDIMFGGEGSREVFGKSKPDFAPTGGDPVAGQPDEPLIRDRPGRDGSGYGLDMKSGFGPDSAFAGLDPGSYDTLAQNPDIAARYLAEKRGGSEWSGPQLAEPMSQALALSDMGLLGGTRGNPRDLSFSPKSGADQLRRAENWLNQLEANGTQPNPSGIYRKMFRRVRNTPVDQLRDSESGGEAGDMTNQINVTTGALLESAAAAGLPQDQLEWLQMRLGQASQEYVMGVAEGRIDSMTMSYPMWLRQEKRAQQWLGR